MRSEREGHISVGIMKKWMSNGILLLKQSVVVVPYSQTSRRPGATKNSIPTVHTQAQCLMYFHHAPIFAVMPSPPLTLSSHPQKQKNEMMFFVSSVFR